MRFCQLDFGLSALMVEHDRGGGTLPDIRPQIVGWSANPYHEFAIHNISQGKTGVLPTFVYMT